MKDVTKENLDGIGCDEEQDKSNSRTSQTDWSSLDTMGLQGIVNPSYSPTTNSELRLRKNGSSVEVNNSIWKFHENEWRLNCGKLNFSFLRLRFIAKVVRIQFFIVRWPKITGSVLVISCS
jgi:hypothetical protein